MSELLTITDDILTNIADAIRTKREYSNLLSPESFADEILAITSEGIPDWMDYGEIVPTEDIAYYKDNPVIIQHNLKTYPRLFIMHDISPLDIPTEIGNTTVVLVAYTQQRGNEIIGKVNNTYANNASSSDYLIRYGLGENAGYPDEHTVALGVAMTEPGYAKWKPFWLLKGHTYFWMAITGH